MNTGTLYLVGLHVGNLQDVSHRTLHYLQTAKNVVVEREEAFDKICYDFKLDKSQYNIIPIEFESVAGEPTGIPHELHNLPKVLRLLKGGEDVYVISDEGMPGVADPGELIIKACIKNNIKVTSTPGPSAVMAAAAVTGVMHNFTFESFLPFTKEQRVKFLQERKTHWNPIIIMLRHPDISDEIKYFLDEAIDVLGKDRKAALCYDLTKPGEKIIFGTFESLKEYFNSNDNTGKQIMMVFDSYNNRMNI